MTNALQLHTQMLHLRSPTTTKNIIHYVMMHDLFIVF